MTIRFPPHDTMLGQGAGFAAKTVSSEASMALTAATELRGAASKAWSGKLNNFSPAHLAARLHHHHHHHHHPLPAQQAMHALGRVRGQFMAGLARLNAALHGAAAHMAHAAGLGFCHGGPSMAPPGLQSPWRFHASAMASTAQWHDASGVQWNAHLNHLTGQHTSATAWSPVDGNGLHHRQVMDHRSGWHGFDVYNSATGQHTSSTPLSAPDQHGTQQRTTMVMNNGDVWHESLNRHTGQHFSVGNWSKPDSEGVAVRAMFDHVTQQLSYERLAPLGQAGRPHTQHHAHFSTHTPSHHSSGPHFYTEPPSHTYQTHPGRPQFYTDHTQAAPSAPRPQFYTDHTQAAPSAPRPQFSTDYTQAAPSAPRPQFSTDHAQNSASSSRPQFSTDYTQAAPSTPRPEFSTDHAQNSASSSRPQYSTDHTQASAAGPRPQFSTDHTEAPDSSSRPEFVDDDAGIQQPLQFSEAEFNAALLALGLAPGASAAEARKAYRKLSMQHHPDKGGNEEDFKTLKAHYDVLTAHFEQA